MGTELKKCVIFADFCRHSSLDAVQRFRHIATGKIDILANCYDGNCTLDLLQTADLAFVFGGDGSILRAATELCELDIPVVGVNVGRLGYLAEFSIEELEQQFDRLIAGELAIEKRMLLRCVVSNGADEVVSATAVNEVAIISGLPLKMTELEIVVDNKPLASCVGDGVIIATPTGSTGYSLSAAGPIISAGLSVITITPLNPHSLSFRPIIIGADRKVQVYPLQADKEVILGCDGQQLCTIDNGCKVEIFRDKSVFNVVNNPIRTQWDTLAYKLKWAQKLDYKI